MKTKLLLLVVVPGLIALGAAGWWLQRSAAARNAVARVLPPLPNLSNAHPELSARILAADARALSRRDPIGHLGELSRLYHVNGYLETAMDCYDGLEQLQPNEPRWPHRHASILAGYGQAQPALALWTRTVKLAPDYLPARLRRADLLLKSNRPGEASAAYEAALESDPGNSWARLGLARLDLEAGRLNEARRGLERVVGQTNYNLGYDLIVTLYERLGMTERAESIRGRAAASGAYRDPPDPWLDELLVDCYDPFRLALDAGTKSRSGDPVAARALLERAITVAPHDLSAHFQLGGLLLNGRDTDGALAAFHRCTELDPNFADGWAQLSALHAQLGNQAEADRLLAAGLTHCPDSPGLHRMKARNLRERNQVGAALVEYRTSIRLRPNEPDTYLEYGMALIAIGRKAEGVHQIRTALDYAPADPTALGILAFNAIEAGNRDEADQWMRRIDAQPRVERTQAERLRDAYRERFDLAWTRGN